ncbi:MAG: hypothetical protein IT561_12965 [Alphaproteobacteria bacterium]|nr:hypothetical protein [Alphaproteobacteria bacterium]
MIASIRAVGAAVALAACAPAIPTAGGDPADPGAEVRPSAHAALLPRQEPFAPAAPQAWRELNDRARRLGGARGQMEGGIGEATPLARP